MAKVHAVRFELRSTAIIEVRLGPWGHGWTTIEGTVYTDRDKEEIDDCVVRGLKIIREG